MIPSLPTQGQIEITNKCNLDCQMCPRQRLGVPLEHMPFDQFQRIVGRLCGVTKVTLTGWGEPFTHPDLFPMIELCKGRGLYTQLTTNGTMLEEKLDSIIGSRLDAITFSVDSIKGHDTFGHENGEALKNVEGLIDRRQGNSPQISLQATLHRGYAQDIYDVIAYAARVGVDRVNLGRLDTRFAVHLLRPSEAEEKEIFKEARRLGRRLGIQVDIIQCAVSTGISRLFYRLLRHGLHRLGRYCLKTYNYFYINVRGEVTPCCGLPNYALGNIFEEDLGSIWQGEKFRYFRENQDRICGQCDLWRIKYLP